MVLHLDSKTQEVIQTHTSNTHHGLPKIMTWTEGRPRKTKLGIHDEARFRGIIGREFYVHSGGFKSVGRLCIGGDCFEMMWSSNGDDLQSPLEVIRMPPLEI